MIMRVEVSTVYKDNVK